MSAETKPAIELREGDVYRFSYSQAEQEKANLGWFGSLRHCFEGFVKRAVSSAASILFQIGELQRAIEGGDLSRKPWW